MDRGGGVGCGLRFPLLPAGDQNEPAPVITAKRPSSFIPNLHQAGS